MNNQGGRAGQFNRNADIHNEVNHHLPIRLVLPSSTNSLIIGSDERLPDRFSRPDLNLPYAENNSNIVPSNNESNGVLDLNISSSSSNFSGSHQMFPDRLQSNIHSSAEDVRNNQDNNLNLSLSLSSHSPRGSRGEEGIDGVFSANTRVLPSKRRYSDLGGEMLTEESSRRGAEFVAQQLVASSDQANSNNNELATINRSSDFEAAIGHQRPVSNMQNQTQAATAPPAYLFLQSDRSPFISTSGTADGATSSVQPLGYAHHFTEPQLASPQLNIMSSRNNAPPTVLPHNSRTMNENSSVARFETQARDNGRIATPLLARTDIRNRFMDEVHATLRSLDAALPISVVRNLPFEQVIQILRNMHNLPTHVQNEDANTGLTEERILKHIKCENLELAGEETPENKETCSICQEEYINGEEVGRLDCVHRFHINCIKQWLVLKNLCPICKQTALAIEGDDAK